MGMLVALTPMRRGYVLVDIDGALVPMDPQDAKLLADLERNKPARADQQAETDADPTP